MKRDLQTRIVAAAACVVLIGSACSTETNEITAATAPSGAEVETAPSGAEVETAPSGAEVDTSQGQSSTTPIVFESGTVHEISVDMDEADYQAMLEEYAETGSKDWVEVTVTIDGTTYQGAGIRLKGNSSLRGLGGGRGAEAGDGVSGTAPEDLPWLIKLDKYVDGQNHNGVNDFVVRSNNSETSLNEAVALDLLEAAGLATQDAIAVRFSVNGSAETLRLVIEHPDDVWMADNFSADGALYKAESTGDYSYRGDDADAYDEVFDQEAGKDNTDLTPLIEFLDFLNNTDDETFAADVDQWLEVDEFADYLAMQEIVQNFDDIDGPGNNSYLYWDAETGLFTVVAWDHNLAFGDAGFGIGGNGGDPAAGFEPPDGAEPGRRPDGTGLPDGLGRPEGGQAGGVVGRGVNAGQGGNGGRGGGGPRGSNILSERMLAIEDFAALYEARLAELTEQLVDSGVAQGIVEQWSDVLRAEADDLVPAVTIDDEAQRLVASLVA